MKTVKEMKKSLEANGISGINGSRGHVPISLPKITESNSSKSLREENRKLVRTMKNYHKGMFNFDD